MLDVQKRVCPVAQEEKEQRDNRHTEPGSGSGKDEGRESVSVETSNYECRYHGKKKKPLKWSHTPF